MTERFRRIGSLSVSVTGLGCDNFGIRMEEEPSREVIFAALDAGINHFDTADNYGNGKSEEFIGKVLGPKRKDVIIGTKFGAYNPNVPSIPGTTMVRPPTGMSGGDPQWVVEACEGSLRRLGTDYLDIFWLHGPTETPIVETMAAMDGLVKAGKVREIGCSQFSPEQLREAATAARDGGLAPFVTVQNEYSLVHRDPESGVLDTCAELSMTLMPYWPLAAGILTGKYSRGKDLPAGTRLSVNRPNYLDRFVEDALMEKVERLEAFAVSRGHTLLELALSWLACNPRVDSVIAGATSAAQVKANVAATFAWELTDEDRREIDVIVPVGA